ncbi:MAG: flagellar biosynthesis protein FlgJ [Thermohalobaculum sp.]|nr:flagellar biosynthesis protein FlgJ [Thermohalobaculum sp.]
MSDPVLPARPATIPAGPSAPRPSSPGTPSAPRGAARDPAATATAFEAAFLTEMLKQSGLTKAFGALAGGGGETGFSDLLTREIATEIARTRPLGIGAAVRQRLDGGGS